MQINWVSNNSSTACGGHGCVLRVELEFSINYVISNFEDVYSSFRPRLGEFKASVSALRRIFIVFFLYSNFNLFHFSFLSYGLSLSIFPRNSTILGMVKW